MENTNDTKFEDDFLCEEDIILGKSEPSSIKNNNYVVINENGEEESFCEPQFEYEREIPEDY
ncbi:hypothetical protein [Clostridium estertheticum]|uniref:Uncharacterized protein n=1 Tax=Clostridium estertheticum TaxID=238834 RepID=A0A7Y3SZB3_9CLOT|nr:hypothetical protein [Clostridium estertheticum]NNU78155.1 hypothetical protein [Clostridium estertheticum]WBL47733.1 hypothetical protein LOR37_03320 [Clostridium estertheticum]